MFSFPFARNGFKDKGVINVSMNGPPLWLLLRWELAELMADRDGSHTGKPSKVDLLGSYLRVR